MAGCEKDIERLELKICKANDRINEVEGRVRSVELRQAVSETVVTNHSTILEKIERNTTWALRLIIGTIIVALLVLIIR